MHTYVCVCLCLLKKRLLMRTQIWERLKETKTDREGERERDTVMGISLHPKDASVAGSFMLIWCFLWCRCRLATANAIKISHKNKEKQIKSNNKSKTKSKSKAEAKDTKLRAQLVVKGWSWVNSNYNSSRAHLSVPLNEICQIHLHQCAVKQDLSDTFMLVCVCVCVFANTTKVYVSACE